MANRVFNTRAEFDAKSPCTKNASLKPNGGWYKEELLAFCKKHNIAGCDSKSTKPQLCLAIGRYFDGVGLKISSQKKIDKAGPSNDFESRKCSAKPGDGLTEWRVGELRDMAKKAGLNLPSKATKTQLCKALAAKFREEGIEHDPPKNKEPKEPSKDKEEAEDQDLSKLSVAALRKLCIERGIKGCQQTKKKETFIAKLKSAKRVSTPPKRVSTPPKRVSTPPKRVSTPSPQKRRQHSPGFWNFTAPKHTKSSSAPRKISAGEKNEFKGRLIREEINKFTAILCAMTYLLRTYRSHMCLPIRPMDLNDQTFGQEELCDIELCWTYRTKYDGTQSGIMEWSFGNDETKFWDTVNDWCKVRFAMVPLYILGVTCNKNESCNNDRVSYESEGPDEQTNQIAHHNFLVFDRQSKTLERFEPAGYGSSYTIMASIYGEDDMNAKLQSSAVAHGYKYMKPIDFCPRSGPQQLELDQADEARDGDPYGFCTYWSLWYADRRMKHPEIPPKELMSGLIGELKTKGTRMKTFIRNYTEHLDKERRRILSKVDANLNDDDKDFESREIMIQELLNELV